MILGFTQIINKKPNYFVRKIWQAIFNEHNLNGYDFAHYNVLHNKKLGYDIDCLDVYDGEEMPKPKIHTIRAGNRWRVGMVIDLFINTRTKNMFRFAPKIPVKHVQNIEIKDITHLSYQPEKSIIIEYYQKSIQQSFHLQFEVKVDGNILNSSAIGLLATNDGFDNTKQFFEYFNKDFAGQIIFWAGDKY